MTADTLDRQETAPEVSARSMILSVEGMTCASCAARIERKLKTVAGVETATVNFASQKAYIRYNEMLKDPTLLQVAVESAG